MISESEKIEERRITSVCGDEYIIGDEIGSGGYAKVYAAKKADGSGDNFVFKEYAKDSLNEDITKTIKHNIENLVANPIRDSNNEHIAHFVRPIDIFEFPDKNSFGYIMERIDTDKYMSLSTLLSTTQNADGSKSYVNYPQADAICNFVTGFAEFFDNIHSLGWSYGDCSDNNTYIDPKTGDFWVIDPDHLTAEDARKIATVVGSHGFIAPEVFEGIKPNTYTDYFSTAVFIYKLFMNMLPYDGPRTEAYMRKNNLNVYLAAPVIYGKSALFAFHPEDDRNSFSQIKNPACEKIVKKWESIPESVRKCFISTFAYGIPYEKRAQRTDDTLWKMTFTELRDKHLVKCPHCGRVCFDSEHTCINCGTELNTSFVAIDRYSIENGEKKSNTIHLAVGKEYTGRELHPELDEKPLFIIKEKTGGDYTHTMKNLSDTTWVVKRRLPTGEIREAACESSREVPLKSAVAIYIDDKKLAFRTRTDIKASK